MRLTARRMGGFEFFVFEHSHLKEHASILVRPVGFEPTTNRFEVCDSIQLSYGRVVSNTKMG